MRFEEMAPEVRTKVRKLRGKLCEKAEQYKGVKPEECQACESPCGYGMQMLDVLGMEKPEQEARKKETFVQDRRMRRIIRGMNRRWRR